MDHLPTFKGRKWTFLRKAAGMAGLSLLFGCSHAPSDRSGPPESSKWTPEHISRISRPCLAVGLQPCPNMASSTMEGGMLLAGGGKDGNEPVMISPNTIMMPRRVWRPLPALPIVERVTPVYPFPSGGLDTDLADDDYGVSLSRGISSSTRGVPKPREIQEESLDAPGGDLPDPGFPGNVSQSAGHVALPVQGGSSPAAERHGNTPPAVFGFGAADPDGTLFPSAAPAHAPAAPQATATSHTPKEEVAPGSVQQASPSTPVADQPKVKPVTGKPPSHQPPPQAKKQKDDAVEVVEDVAGKNGAKPTGTQPQHGQTNTK
ncbi:MAG: hypothetical protein HQL63_15420 [Magnetococcales bacterium]|nr:hypothetical protein [Magnetococcales bacterium]MBF0322918.1 hypothetical protein [Magnetococcales bacterium]